MSVQDVWNKNEAILQSHIEDIIVTNAQGIVQSVSAATEEVYGVCADKMVGRSVYDLEEEGLFTPLATSLVLEKKEKVTFIQTTREGKKLLITGIPVYGQGELIHIVSYSHDVTELIEMKKYLAQMEDEMARAKSELEMLRDQHLDHEGFIANSGGMKTIISTVLQVSKVDVNVLLLGETGVGKSHVAKLIHKSSPRKNGPFIEVNCGAIPENLFEAEFFGYEEGSFTGSKKGGKLGLTELADGGTLFLDELGALSLTNQVKVLKLIQEKQFYRVGGTKLRKVDFRLIGATNENLEEAVKKKTFREDLYFRLNVVPITIPPLRKRQEDLIPLINHFVGEFSAKYQLKRILDESVIQQLLAQDWKGNVRELINLIERLVVISPSSIVTMDHLPESYRRDSYVSLLNDSEESLSEILEQVEKYVLTKSKKKHKTTVKMAQSLGISQPSVVRKLKKYGID